MFRIYLRVSSKQQDTKSQEPDLHAWAKSKTDVKFYPADKATGKNMDRPHWSRLIADCVAGDTIVVWRLDRLGRTAKGLTGLFEELRERKINLVSLKDGIDLGTAAGRMMANVLASIAQFETELRGERVLAGQAVARANGKTWGGATKGRRVKVTDEQLKVIQAMKGSKIASIARATGLSRPTIYQYI